jgi:hypothetical protein
MTTITMDTNLYGMAVKGRTIYYCAGYKGLKMLNLSDRSVSDIISSEMSCVTYVATSGDKLYYTNTNTDTVTCMTLSIRGDNHDVARNMTDYIHVPIIVYRDTMWIL